MSHRFTLARFLFDTTSFSSSATQRTWRTVVAAGAMIGAAYVVDAPDADADAERVAQMEKKAPPPAPAPPPDTIRAEPAPAIGAQMTLDQPTIDFGTIEAGKKKTVEFTFVNTGTAPLKLDRKKMKSSCRCLVATLPRAPIAPGGRGLIKATFTAPRTAGDASHNLVIKFVVNPLDKAEGSAVLAIAGTVSPRRPRTPVVPRNEGRGFILS